MSLFNWRTLALLTAARLAVAGGEKRDAPAFDVFQYVNPLIGTENGGETLPISTRKDVS